MYEIRLHGRGGQGVKLAAHILGKAAFLSGYRGVQSFAKYGAERRGAPVTSFVRMDKKEVLERGYISNPDFVICLDDTLDFDIVKNGLKKDGIILINTNKYPGHFADKKIKNKIFTIDATKIAMETLGVPIPNTAILGAFIKIFRKIPLDILKRAVENELEEEGKEPLIEKNKKVVEICYKEMKV